MNFLCPQFFDSVFYFGARVVYQKSPEGPKPPDARKSGVSKSELKKGPGKAGETAEGIEEKEQARKNNAIEQKFRAYEKRRNDALNKCVILMHSKAPEEPVGQKDRKQARNFPVSDRKNSDVEKRATNDGQLFGIALNGPEQQKVMDAATQAFSLISQNTTDPATWARDATIYTLPEVGGVAPIRQFRPEDMSAHPNHVPETGDRPEAKPAAFSLSAIQARVDYLKINPALIAKNLATLNGILAKFNLERTGSQKQSDQEPPQTRPNTPNEALIATLQNEISRPGKQAFYERLHYIKAQIATTYPSNDLNAYVLTEAYGDLEELRKAVEESHDVGTPGPKNPDGSPGVSVPSEAALAGMKAADEIFARLPLAIAKSTMEETLRTTVAMVGTEMTPETITRAFSLTLEQQINSGAIPKSVKGHVVVSCPAYTLSVTLKGDGTYEIQPHDLDQLKEQAKQNAECQRVAGAIEHYMNQGVQSSLERKILGLPTPADQKSSGEILLRKLFPVLGEEGEPLPLTDTKELGNWMEELFQDAKDKISGNPGEITEPVKVDIKIAGTPFTVVFDTDGAITLKGDERLMVRKYLEKEGIRDTELGAAVGEKPGISFEKDVRILNSKLKDVVAEIEKEKNNFKPEDGSLDVTGIEAKISEKMASILQKTPLTSAYIVSDSFLIGGRYFAVKFENGKLSVLNHAAGAAHPTPSSQKIANSAQVAG